MWNPFQNSVKKTLQNARLIRDVLPAIILIIIALGLTLVTMQGIGITWDEPEYNFSNSLRQVQWLKLAAKDIFQGHFGHPFKKEVIAEYWDGNRHQTLARTLSGISWLLFHRLLGDIIAFRLSSSIMFALLVGLLYIFISQTYSWKEGLFAACTYLLMPHPFGHAHIAALDTPITFMWFATTYAFWRGITNYKWAILTGVIYGAALSTKIHALFIPIPLLLWSIWIHGIHRKRNYLNNLLSMVTIAPIVSFLIQPWLWHDTFPKIVERLFNYTHRSTTVLIPVYYFGKTYHFSPPWHYPFVMALVTVPPGVVLSYLIALFRLRFHRSRSIVLLLFLNALTSLSLLLLPTAPGYDGVRLFLPAFPFLAGLAGIGFGHCLDLVSAKVELWRNPMNKQFIRVILTCILVILLLGSSIFSLIDAYPYFLSYFNVLIGGVRGAHLLGMESTYWGDAVNQSVLDYLNTYTERDATVAFLVYNPRIAQYYKEKNMLRRDIKLPLEADYWILTARQGMFTYHTWLLYKRVRPSCQFSYNGVPLVLVYKSKEIPHRIRLFIIASYRLSLQK